MVVFGGRGPTPWRGPQPQTQAQHPHQSSWPGPTTSASGDCAKQLLSCVSIYSFSSGYHHPCRQSSTSRPSQLWQFGWVPFSCTGVMLTRKNAKFERITLIMKYVSGCENTLCWMLLYHDNWHVYFNLKASNKQFDPWVCLCAVRLPKHMCVCECSSIASWAFSWVRGSWDLLT